MGQGPYHDHQWMMGGSWGWVGMLAFWVLLIAGIVFLVRWAASQGRERPTAGPRSDAPLDILKRRYASGEINRDEFEQKKRDLS